MPDTGNEAIDSLLKLAAKGDDAAIADLLQSFRPRLGRMVRCRMDPRLARRFDPSDVVQDALLVASRKLPDYVHDQPVAFYPWLRRLVWERLVDLQRQHLTAERRSIAREEPWQPQLSDESIDDLTRSIAAPPAGPLTSIVRRERVVQMRDALLKLDDPQREVLVLRYLEGLKLHEVAEVMGTTLAATKMKHMRALRRLREILRAG